MSTLNSSGITTENGKNTNRMTVEIIGLLDYIQGCGEPIKLPLFKLTTKQYLELLTQHIENCRSFLKYAGITTRQAICSQLGAFSTAEVHLMEASPATAEDRVVALTDDFRLPMMLGFGKGASFAELTPPMCSGLHWLHHVLCVGEFGNFLLMSVSEEHRGPPEFVQARFLRPSDQFLDALFSTLTEMRLVCLQRLNSMLDQQVKRYEERLAALRLAQGRLNIVLSRAM